MAGRPTPPVLRFVRGLAPAAADEEAPDEELLARFAAGRDGAAFAALVRRHGPAVYGACARALGDTPDAEDAFQATFLVLARRAGSVARPHLLAAWLYGVAVRTARKARTRAARRRAAERRADPRAGPDPADEIGRLDLGRVLIDELARLPERYRVPLVLCCLEGRTHADAARRLGCPRQTVTTRVARGCARLRAALARRGVSVSAPALGAALAGTARAVPPGLTERTVGAAAAGVVPAGVAALVREDVMTLCVSKLKRSAALALAVGVAAAALGRPEPPGGRPPGAKDPPTPPAAPARPDAAGAELKALQGRWEGQSAEEDGRALGEAEARRFLVSVKGDRMLLIPGGEWTPLAIELDPGKDPKVLRMAPAGGADKGKAVPVIYRIDREADTLTLCWDVKAGKAVPAGFAAGKGSGLLLLVLKHEPRPPAGTD